MAKKRKAKKSTTRTAKKRTGTSGKKPDVTDSEPNKTQQATIVGDITGGKGTPNSTMKYTPASQQKPPVPRFTPSVVSMLDHLAERKEVPASSGWPENFRSPVAVNG